MNISSIRTVALEPPPADFGDKARGPEWLTAARLGSPMTRYPRYVRRLSWTPTWEYFGVVVTAEDGTQGFARCNYGRPVATIVSEYLGPRLEGEPALETATLHDMMMRLCSPFGSQGLASFAISAIDLALWDLKGKVLGKPVYELIGGPAKDEIVCYATGEDTDWHLELGFGATKRGIAYGPESGEEGLRRETERIAQVREQVGDDIDLMVDCWMTLDVDYAARLAEALRPYRIRWIEEALRPEDMDAHAELRARVPWAPLATGEHWHTAYPFKQAAGRRVVDILQPDVTWVGGLTTLLEIDAIARAAGLTLIPHGGVSTAYGQHAVFALASVPLGEYWISSPAGVPLEDAVWPPGTPVPRNGRLRPSDAPGFGEEIDPSALPPFPA